jgi:CheY-like chemotaxis protein
MEPRVLVADDDADTLTLVSNAIEGLGYTVIRADDGNEMLQMLAEGNYQLIITDVAMPWMTGLQVAHSARTAGVSSPVIVMTASRIRHEDVALLGDNAVLLHKPFSLSRLRDVVRRLLTSDHECC